MDWTGVEWDGLDFIRQIPPFIFMILMVEGLSQTLHLKFIAWMFWRFQNFESKDLGSWFPSLEFSRNVSLSRVCEGTVHSAQRGFRRGKLITDSVLELEARIMKELYTGARCPARPLIDIKAAFPSVAWD